MNLLFVSATAQEINPFINHFNFDPFAVNNFCGKESLEISFLNTGPGLLATAVTLSHHLTKHKYNLVINAGIAGAFNHDVSKGTVFNVYRDTIADLGAEHSDGSFQNIFEIGLTDLNEFPYRDGWLYPVSQSSMVVLPSASAVTVNKVTGSQSSIQQIYEKYQPDLESMEGAAVFYTCNIMNTPSIQIRSVSNHIEPRNKANWNIPLAIKALNDYLIEFIQSIKKDEN